MRFGWLIGVVLVVLATPMRAQAQTWQPPSERDRCPSKWGAAGERGSGNHMKPDTVMRAARLIRSGEVFELAHVVSPAMPFFGTRWFDITVKRTFMNPQPNRRGSNEELHNASHVFALIVQPLKIQGGTGSTVAAVR